MGWFGRSRTAEAERPRTASEAAAARARNEQAQREKDQRDFDRWCEYKLFPLIDLYLRASERGDSAYQGELRHYDLVLVRVMEGNVGVCVTSFDSFTSPVIESRYRGLGYTVETEEIENAGLAEPMRKTEITYG